MSAVTESTILAVTIQRDQALDELCELLAARRRCQDRSGPHESTTRACVACCMQIAGHEERIMQLRMIDAQQRTQAMQRAVAAAVASEGQGVAESADGVHSAPSEDTQSAAVPPDSR